ncbi:MAG TPA: methanol dehydrogenase [Clostridiales bacterium]|nr:methanol dehydrogenase [Clostridiales bacterium]
MKHKLICLILCLLLLPSLFLSASAEQQYVIDNADLMSSSEEAALEEKVLSLREEYAVDVVILTVDSLDGQRPQDYADDYYDHNGYADDGLLFLLSMEERDWYISTKGSAIYALTDYGIQQVGETALPYLKNGDYYGAFDTFLDALPTYFSAYSDGAPIDGYADTSGDYYHGDQEDVVYYEDQPRRVNILISIAIGAVIGGITVLIMRACMNTKRPQRSAGSYLDDSSYHLRTDQDLFLYSNVTKTRIQQESSSSGGGGSSVHTSSSGSSHGGGGGKF